MNYLESIYHNKIGTAYAVKSYNEESLNANIQLQIGDFAILMTATEMPSFLKVIQSVKNKGCCTDCKKKCDSRVIKFNTQYASIRLNANLDLITNLEELILAVICNYQVEMILKDNNID